MMTDEEWVELGASVSSKNDYASNFNEFFNLDIRD